VPIAEAAGEEDPQDARPNPSWVAFDCGHHTCLECATGMLRAKKDDSPDALNLLVCPCARLEGCGGVLFLAETTRVVDVLENINAHTASEISELFEDAEEDGDIFELSLARAHLLIAGRDTSRGSEQSGDAQRAGVSSGKKPADDSNGKQGDTLTVGHTHEKGEGEDAIPALHTLKKKRSWRLCSTVVRNDDIGSTGEGGRSKEIDAAVPMLVDGQDPTRLPIRPHVSNCVLYIRSGTCSFGEACRFNHPPKLLGVEGEGQRSLYNVAAIASSKARGAVGGQGSSSNGRAHVSSSNFVVVPDIQMHLIVGRGGATIRNMEEQTRAHIQVSMSRLPSTSDSSTSDRVLTLSGSSTAMRHARALILAKLEPTGAALTELSDAARANQLEPSVQELAARQLFDLWTWYQEIAQGYTLRCAGLFSCTSPSCIATGRFIQVPPPTPSCSNGTSDDSKDRSTTHLCPPGSLQGDSFETLADRATAMCKQCRVNVCGNCTWKAQRIVAFHAPLPCQHRVLVESCVARVESAMQDLERKHAAANASARRGGRSVRPGRGDQDKDSQVGTESSQKGTDSIKELPKSMPTLSEMIEVLMQLGRTAEVKTLREIEAGSYEAPVKGVEELTSAQLISSSSKPCPTGCGWDITKDKGCNHMTCKKCGHKFCWRCLQARPRESDAHDCQGAPDVASFDPKVQNLIRRVLQSYDPSVETRPVVSNPLVADAAAIVSFASSYLFCPTHTGSKDAAGGVGSGGKDLLEEDVTIEEASGRKVISHSEQHQGTGADGKKCSVSPEEKEIEAVQKLLARLRKLWEGRSDMFEALAQEQHTETGAEGDARDGIPMLHRRLQRRREEMQAMMMERLEGDEFDAVDWRLRTHRRMQRRENIEVEIQRQARVRDEQQRLLLRRLLLEEISSTLGGGSGSAAGHGPHDASEGVSGTESLTAEEVEAKVERCAEVYAEYNHLHLELQRVLQVRQAVVDYEAPSAAARAGARPFEIERARGGGVMFDARERIARERIAFLENMRQRHAMLYAHRVEQRATGAAVAMPSSLRAWEPSQDADLLNRYLVRAEPVGSGAGGAGAGSNSSNSRVDGLSGDSALPRHWHQDADSEGRTYYWNRHLGLSQWARPVAPTELTPSAYAATAAPTSSLAAIAQARVAGDGVNTTPTVAPQQDAWQQLSLLVDQRRQRMMALSGAGTHGLEERDELDDSMRAASRSMAARAIQQRESLLSAAAGTGGIGGATAPEQMPVSREPAEQGAGDRIQFVPLRRPHRAEVGGLAPMEGAPGDDSTFSEMLLSVLEFHICSLSWNVSCKLFALGQLLGQLPHALPSPQPLVRLVDLLTVLIMYICIYTCIQCVRRRGRRASLRHLCVMRRKGKSV